MVEFYREPMVLVSKISMDTYSHVNPGFVLNSKMLIFVTFCCLS